MDAVPTSTLREGMVVLPVIATRAAPKAKPKARSGRNQEIGVEESGPPTARAAANCNDRDFGTSRRQLCEQGYTNVPCARKGLVGAAGPQLADPSGNG